ncbi:PKD domain-containing protein [Arthrobacter liuii]
MKIKRCATTLAPAVLAALIVAGGVVWSPPASADPVYGTQSFTYTGVSNPPTSDKPQSKLWWNDGSWWADMWTTGSGWHIYRLDRAAHSWVDTGVLNDARGSTLADTLWDGTHLYIASHVVGVSTNANPVPSVAGQPAYLYRYSYSGGKYTLDAGFPTVITDNSSESMTIDEDSTGAIWATWTQVAADNTSGFTNTVYANNSAPGGTSWASPFVLPVSNPHPSPDDIAAVVSYGKNKIGVMWSDQLTGTIWWATRTDGTSATAPSSWNFQPAIRGSGQADDHLNVKSLQSDPSGRVFAAVKTSLNDISSDPTLPQLLLLVFKPGTGSFTQSTISTAGDCVTRPQIVLDTQNNLVHAFQTAPPTSVSSCAYSGVAGSIYEKTASMDNPTFGAGRGNPIMQAASSSNINDVTTSKQGVNATTGIVMLASDDVAKSYWFSDEPLTSGNPTPVASFTATPNSGTVPLSVAFKDTSTGTPTSWSWNFGDGTAASTVQDPTHTYSAAATYTATLTATYGTGSTESASSTITVLTLAQAMDAKAAQWNLGAPVGDVAAIRDGGYYRNYQSGAIISAPTHNLFVSHGAIRSEWAALNFENGLMGYPTTDEVGGLVNGGVYQNYEGGAIIWTPATGPHESFGSIRSEWQALGFEGGVLAYPTSEVVTGLINGGSYQNYQGGAIVSSPASGTHESYGAIRTAWMSTGFERGALGYPTSEIYSVPNGTAQDFQGGRINDVNGTTTIAYSTGSSTPPA